MLKFITALFTARPRMPQRIAPLMEDHRVQKEPTFRRSRRRAYAAAYARDPIKFAPPRAGSPNNPPMPRGLV